MTAALADRLQKLCDRDKPSYNLLSTAKGILDGLSKDYDSAKKRDSNRNSFKHIGIYNFLFSCCIFQFDEQ